MCIHIYAFVLYLLTWPKLGVNVVVGSVIIVYVPLKLLSQVFKIHFKSVCMYFTRNYTKAHIALLSPICYKIVIFQVYFILHCYVDLLCSNAITWNLNHFFPLSHLSLSI